MIGCDCANACTPRKLARARPYAEDRPLDNTSAAHARLVGPDSVVG